MIIIGEKQALVRAQAPERTTIHDSLAKLGCEEEGLEEVHSVDTTVIGCINFLS